MFRATWLLSQPCSSLEQAGRLPLPLQHFPGAPDTLLTLGTSGSRL